MRRTAKAVTRCFPSLFPRNVSFVLGALYCARIHTGVVSGLMHYSVLYFTFCATSRIYTCV